jgi:hypothetical protein
MSSSSIISGGIGPTIAFLLAVAWDTLKDRRDIGRHDQAVIVAIRMELAANLPVVRTTKSRSWRSVNAWLKANGYLTPSSPSGQDSGTSRS